MTRLSFRKSADYGTRELTHLKLNILERQGRTEEFLALCLRAGAHLRYALKLVDLDRIAEAVTYARKRFAVAAEALKLAERLREANHLDEAIRIAEGGLKLEGRKAELGEWLAPIEEAQGRTSQAIDAWMAVMRAEPTLAIWKTIKRLAATRWKKLKPEAMAALETSWDKQPLAEVLLFEEQWEEAIKVAEQKSADYRVVALVAEGVMEQHPEWVIRVCLKQSDSLLVQTQSKLYPIAADWLRRAKTAYLKMGRSDEWKDYLQQLKERYKRRPALQAQLAKL